MGIWEGITTEQAKALVAFHARYQQDEPMSQASTAFRAEIVDAIQWMLNERQTYGTLLNEAGTTHTAISFIYHGDGTVEAIVGIGGQRFVNASVDYLADRLLKKMGYRLNRY